MIQLLYDSCMFGLKKTTFVTQNVCTSDLISLVEEEISDSSLNATLDFYLVQNGKIVGKNDIVGYGNVHVVPRLVGGKGGFGSMLRAIGAQIEKTTNREACRDLSGRRLRDINEEKRLKKWIAEQAEREQEQLENKKKKLNKLSSEPKHEFSDATYDKIRSEMQEKVFDAVEQGLKATSDVPSCSTSTEVKKAKKRTKGRVWLDIDELDDMDSSSSEKEDESLSNVTPPKKLKASC